VRERASITSETAEHILVERIIIATGLGESVEEYSNLGDISMLQIAVERLRKLFPKAYIQVLTNSSDNLARFCPAATPLDDRGRALWLSSGVLLGKYADAVPKWVVNLLVRLKNITRARLPDLLRVLVTWRLKYMNRHPEADALRAFVGAFRNADLLLICGSGGFYDGCEAWNTRVLELLDAATQQGISAVMLGQGFGPLTDRSVLARAARVLPMVDFITLRGNRGALAAIRSLGVLGANVQITGDEALELAYDSRSEEPGKGLGINLRFAGSASTDMNDVKSIRTILQDFARRHRISLIPLPIAMEGYTKDDLAIKQLLAGFDEQSDGGKTLDSPLKVIRQAALCRVVVTGAYHAAVFALGQGIPVVGLAKSAYFSSKFLGLEDQFGEGCQTIALNEPAVSQKLYSAIERAWQNADRLREPLLTAALSQIELSRKSYQRIEELLANPVRSIADRANA